LDGLEEPNI